MATIDWKSLNILIVDDDKAQRRLQELILNQMGVQKVRPAKNGLSALIELASGEMLFDLVISDLDMPTMNGFDFVEKLRNGPDNINSNIPVIIATSHREHDNVQKALKLGVQGFLAKPINEAKLRMAITRALGG